MSILMVGVLLCVNKMVLTVQISAVTELGNIKLEQQIIKT